MTPDRAQAIIQEAYDTCVHGPWSDRLDKVMSKEERDDVEKVWDTMPGHTCFVDAIFRIARQVNPLWNVKELTKQYQASVSFSISYESHLPIKTIQKKLNDLINSHITKGMLIIPGASMMDSHVEVSIKEKK